MDLQRISDRLEIEEVLTRYTRAIDTGAWDRLDAVFTADARIDYTQSGGIEGGYAEVKAWLAENLPAFPRRMHTLGQVEIEHDAEGARVAAYFHNPMTLPAGAGEERLVEVGGLYHHRMVRTPDGWRSRRLVEELVWKRAVKTDWPRLTSSRTMGASVPTTRGCSTAWTIEKDIRSSPGCWRSWAWPSPSV